MCFVGTGRMALCRLRVSGSPKQMGVRKASLFLFGFKFETGLHSFRHYIGIFREETLLGRLSSILSSVQTHNFHVVSLEPHQKDGGVFVRFTYSANESRAALDIIQRDVMEAAAKQGGIPSWIGVAKGNVWLVKGTPWREVRSLLHFHNGRL